MDRSCDKGKQKMEDYDSKSVLLSIIASLFLALITYHLFGAGAGSPISSLIAFVLTATLTGVFMFIAHSILTIPKNCQQPTQQQITGTNRGRTFFKAFSLSTDVLNSSNASATSLDNKSQTSNNRRKIDPKFFKPRYIMNELMTMWGTTYTVITWGSVWVIGGTIVATEKLAQKIKTKCSREQTSGLSHQNSSRSTGRQDSFATDSSSMFDRTTEADSSQSKSSLRKVRTWTKKSYASAKRKFNKFFISTVPQIMNTSQSEL